VGVDVREQLRRGEVRSCSGALQTAVPVPDAAAGAATRRGVCSSGTRCSHGRDRRAASAAPPTKPPLVALAACLQGCAQATATESRFQHRLVGEILTNVADDSARAVRSEALSR